jgi:hypothetical protein
MALGRREDAREVWLAVKGWDDPETSWQGLVLGALLKSASAGGHRPFVRALIAESKTEDAFFPLARALDYLESGNESLIEKLTPETRPIVKEVIDRLQQQ